MAVCSTRKNTYTRAKLVLCVAFCCPVILLLFFIKIKPRNFSFKYGDRTLNSTWNETGDSDEVVQTEVPECKANDNSDRKPLFELNYTYVIDGRHTCEPADDVTSLPSIVVIVHSRISSSDQRDAIRNTWGVASRRYDDDQPMVKVVFLLGRGLNATTTRIEQENRLYRDVIVADFKDTYRNLTLKSLFGMHWARTLCRSAEYIVKADDDVYLDIDLLRTVLLNASEDGRRVIYGSLNARARVQRRGLWKVKTNLYSSNYFPPYCSGNAYAMTSSVADCLLAGISLVPYFPLEDVYVTGMLAKAKGITCRGHSLFPQWYVGPTGQHIRMLLEGKLVALHNVHYTQMRGIFDKLVARKLKRQTANG